MTARGIAVRSAHVVVGRGGIAVLPRRDGRRRAHAVGGPGRESFERLGIAFGGEGWRSRREPAAGRRGSLAFLGKLPWRVLAPTS
jgi:hypothetical protein